MIDKAIDVGARGGGGRGRAADAFTLVEVMVATAVMALSLVAAIIGIQIGINHLDVARTSTAVAQVLQAEAERVRMLNWVALSALPAEAEIDLTGTIPSEAIASGRVRVWRTITDVSGFANMKEVRLRGVWTSLDGAAREREFRLRYTKGGLHDYYYGSSGG
jgi:prepilin-type N-terminal cleavage/methylation domain